MNKMLFWVIPLIAIVLAAWAVLDNPGVNSFADPDTGVCYYITDYGTVNVRYNADGTLLVLDRKEK